MDRGFRNNNPGNIRLGQEWQGMANDQTDPDFVVFTSPDYGIRAIARILQHYAKLGITTLEAVINRWAPPNENNTLAYVSAVSSQSGVAAGDDVTSANIASVIKAIITHENGSCPYDDATIAHGIELAGE